MSRWKHVLKGSDSSAPRAALKAWLGVADEVLKAVETTAHQARAVAEQAQVAARASRGSVHNLTNILRDTLRSVR